jgi:hypothetical protein
MTIFVGIVIICVAWGIGISTGWYGAALYSIALGYGVLLSSPFLRWRPSRDWAKKLAFYVSFLLFSGYAFAAAGVHSGAFGEDAPYLVISAIYLSVPITLAGAAAIMGHSVIASRLITAFLSVILIVASYLDYVMIELLFEMPMLLRPHLSPVSTLHFYNSLMAVLMLAVPIVILCAFIRAVGLPYLRKNPKEAL